MKMRSTHEVETSDKLSEKQYAALLRTGRTISKHLSMRAAAKKAKNR